MVVRVVIVEDHLLALEAMSAKLKKHADIEIVAKASSNMDTDGFLRLIRRNQPHVVILDLSLKVPNLDPFAAIAALKDAYPAVEILALIRREEGILLRWLTSFKVKGCLFNDDEQTLSLATVVRKISEGRQVYSQEIVERFFQLSELTFTPRELDVLALVGEGQSNGEIAMQLSISIHTVRNHLSHIYAKLSLPQDPGLNRRVYAVNVARRLGLAQRQVH